MWDNNNFTLIAEKGYDESPGPPYQPVWHTTSLYKADIPAQDKNGDPLHYILTAQLSIGGKWLNESTAMEFVSECHAPRQRAPR